MKLKFVFALLIVAMLLAMVPAANAAPNSAVACAEVYTVTAGDSLSALADKFLGNIKAYWAIMGQTNYKHVEDASFTLIKNPDVLEVGDKLCIPSKADADAILVKFGDPAKGNVSVLFGAAAKGQLLGGNWWTSGGELAAINAVYDLYAKAYPDVTIVNAGVAGGGGVNFKGANLTKLQGTQRVGRRIETRLRIAFLEKIPRLGDRYFFSRLTSDMANRAHMLVSLRNLPMLAVNFLRLTFQFILTSIAVLYLDPNHALLAIAFSMLFVALAYFTNPILQESSMRVNVLTGAISRFYLDAMLGLVPLKSHGAERALRREQEGLTTDWMRANLSAQRVGMLVQGASSLLYSLFAIVMVFAAAAQGGSSAELLLLFFWTLSLPVLAQGVVQSIQQYPDIRTMILRILEPLSAPEETTDAENGTAARAQNAQASKGIAVKFENVLIQAGGQTILSDLNLQIAAGEHLAIVGPSGAGKSSFVGILLGWHKPVQGQVWIDDAAFDGARLKILRQETAWVDPAVLLWNRSMLENLTYGATDREFALTALIEQADLYAVLNRLPEGLQTELGEGGGLVSGGEGQRVRLGRAMNRSQARLVILDEPFRGLDRDQRRELLKRARAYWHNATLLCVTHDIGETQTFDRVLVVEQGHIVEDAAPEILAAQSGSRYRALLESEQAVRQTMWDSTNWRQVRVAEGKVTVQDTDDARADA